MNWEAVSALAAAFTGVVIAATVILGIRQLRLTRDTLEHLRRATQLEGAMQIFADLTTPQFRESQHFILNDLDRRMEDADFREGVHLVGMADLKLHKELHLMRTFERIGAYVRHGLIDGAIVYDVALPIIMSTWEELAEVTEIHRKSLGEGLWENFEFLYRDGKAWQSRSRAPGFLRQYVPHWSRLGTQPTISSPDDRLVGKGS
jgi:hypothetical protein